jgi:hypothetical protein
MQVNMMILGKPVNLDNVLLGDVLLVLTLMADERGLTVVRDYPLPDIRLSVSLPADYTYRRAFEFLAQVSNTVLLLDEIDGSDDLPYVYLSFMRKVHPEAQLSL